MTQFVDLPREIRYMIYKEVLQSKFNLIGYNQLRNYSEHQPLSLALLVVSKVIGSEAKRAFYDANVFKLSWSAFLGFSSLFTTQASHFRNLRLVFCDVESRPLWLAALEPERQLSLVDAWKLQIRALASIPNLKFLELEVSCIATTRWPRIVEWPFPELEDELLSNIPESFRIQQRSRSSGL